MSFNRFLVFLCLISSVSLKAQGVEMADAMRSSGKIYVVVGVLSIVFAGIVFWLVRLDRKISKLEKESTHNSRS